MSPRYMEALCEVEYVIGRLGEDEQNCIPESLMTLISSKKAKHYVAPQTMEKAALKKETLAILAVLYRKYLATEAEKTEFEKQFKIEMANRKKAHEVLKTEIFETKDAEVKKEEPKAVVVYQKVKWYEKLFGMFRRVK